MADETKKNLHISQTRSNPHGEQTVAAVESRMNPSVTNNIDPTDDSMFNNADPQTRELQKKDKPNRSQRQRKTNQPAKRVA